MSLWPRSSSRRTWPLLGQFARTSQTYLLSWSHPNHSRFIAQNLDSMATWPWWAMCRRGENCCPPEHYVWWQSSGWQNKMKSGHSDATLNAYTNFTTQHPGYMDGVNIGSWIFINPATTLPQEDILKVGQRKRKRCVHCPLSKDRKTSSWCS